MDPQIKLLLSECIGMMVFIAIGTAVSSSVLLKKTMASGLGTNWVMIAFGWGFAVAFGVYTAVFLGGPAHLNPAVTIGMAVMGVFPWASVPGFILAQILGAFIGAGITMLHYYPHFKITGPDEGNCVNIFATGATIDNKPFNFLSEVIATFFFILVLLTIGPVAEGMFPLLVGFLVVAMGFSFGSTTGYAMNPARDFGPRLAYTLLPLPNKGPTNWDYVWIPVAGPIVGALLAILLLAAIA